MGNTAWSAVIILVGGIGLGVLVWAVLWGDRSRGRRRCPKCWYAMEGIEGLRCPECGHQASTQSRLRRTRRRWRGGLLGVMIIVLSAGGGGLVLAQKGLWLRVTPTWLLMQIVDQPDYTRAQQMIALRGGRPANPLTPMPPGVAGGPARGGVVAAPIPTALPASGKLPPASIAGQLATELARRHIEQELSPGVRRELARQAFPDFEALTLDDVVGYQREWVHGAVMRPDFHAGAIGSRWPAAPLTFRIIITADGRPALANDNTTSQPHVRHRGRILTRADKPGLQLFQDRDYAVRIAIVDPQGDLLERTFDMPIDIHDDLSDVFTVASDRAIAHLRSDVLRIRPRRPLGGYDFVFTDPEVEGSPELAHLVLESGPPELPNEMSLVPLTRSFIGSWPVLTFGTPVYAQPLPAGGHTWPLRLVNNAEALLHDESARFCLPEDGVELDFQALQAGD